MSQVSERRRILSNAEGKQILQSTHFPMPSLSWSTPLALRQARDCLYSASYNGSGTLDNEASGESYRYISSPFATRRPTDALYIQLPRLQNAVPA